MPRRIQFTAEHERLIRGNFDLLDDDKDGKLNEQQAGTLFRALGQTITDQDLKEVVNGFMGGDGPTDAGDAKGCTFDRFISLFAQHYKDPVQLPVLCEAFQVFDTLNTGFMSASVLVDLLTKQGEPLSSKELDQILLLATVNKQTSQFDYTALAKRLIDGPAGIHNL